ncbi:hypothetical protein BWR22_00320 [Lacinutrix venerupis]|uniref:Uncharacterized protein n=1 Tax=Lacinutrix venerupis TaxID=1486034 RepID=A0AAC9LK06_9FLAO|nr:hypothetical protein BWR22_00320 [Lacinutrix venerupis]
MTIWEKKNKLIRALPKGQAIRYIFFLPYMAAKKRMPLLSLTQKTKALLPIRSAFIFNTITTNTIHNTVSK